MSVRTFRRESGDYVVYRNGVEVGEIVRDGPNHPSSPWIARSGDWVVRGETKHAVKDALVLHLIAQNGHAKEDALVAAIAYAGSDVPEPHVPVPKPPLGPLRELASEGDQERFTYLAWEEVKDRLALTRGLVLDVLTRRDIYRPDERQTGILRRGVESIDRVLFAMRKADEEGW